MFCKELMKFFYSGSKKEFPGQNGYSSSSDYIDEYIDRLFFKSPETYVHSTAVVGKNVVLGNGVKIGPFSVIVGNTVIGAGTKIYNNVVIGAPAQHREVFEPLGRVVIGKNVEIGDGTVVMAGAVINPSSKIGEQSIINTSSVIEHDSQIGNFSTIAPKVAMGGGVQIGNFSTISIGATVKHLIKIGDDVVVGANSLVLKNLPNNIVAYGLPAKKIRERKREDKYL